MNVLAVLKKKRVWMWISMHQVVHPIRIDSGFRYVLFFFPFENSFTFTPTDSKTS